jgi:hypothetical protein
MAAMQAHAAKNRILADLNIANSHDVWRHHTWICGVRPASENHRFLISQGARSQLRDPGKMGNPSQVQKFIESGTSLLFRYPDFARIRHNPDRISSSSF